MLEHNSENMVGPFSPTPNHEEIREYQHVYEPEPEFVFFWDGPYSQWAYSPFHYRGHKFETAEHYMMFSKAMFFKDHDNALRILKEPDPSEVKKIGREIPNYVEEEWARVRYDVVTIGTILKFSQNPDFYQTMVDDMGKIIVEASPYDRIWGIGLRETDSGIYNIDNWQGDNLLGYAIMRARARLAFLENGYGLML